MIKNNDLKVRKTKIIQRKIAKLFEDLIENLEKKKYKKQPKS